MSVIILVLGAIFCFGIFSKSDYIYTTNLEDYYAEEVYNHSGVLPEKIPNQAKVVQFYYYNYWHEDIDVFLELQFESESEMNTYLDSYTKQCRQQYYNQYGKSENCFIEKNNPYNQPYTELYYIKNHTSSTDGSYLGYAIDPDGDAIHNFKCHFGVVSYSYTDLRVIFSYVLGSFRNKDNHYTPVYFTRFNVPNTEKLEYYIFLEE